MAVSDSDWFLVASGTTNYKVSAADMAEYVNINSPTAGGGGGSCPPCPAGITQVPAITTNAKEGSVVAISTPPVSTEPSLTPTYQWMRKPWFLNESTITVTGLSPKNVTHILESPDTPVVFAAMYKRAGGGSTFADNATWTVYQSFDFGISWSKCPGIDENQNGEINGIAVGPGGRLLIATQQAYKFNGNSSENRATIYFWYNGTLSMRETGEGFANAFYLPTVATWAYATGDRIYYTTSQNAISFDDFTYASGVVIKDVKWFPAAGKFILTGSGGMTAYATTLTGTWTVNSSVSPYNFEQIAISGGTAVSVGAAGLTAYTQNGTSWTVRPSGDSYNIGAVAVDNGYFIATKANSGLAISHDGVTWKTQAVAGGTRGLAHTSFGLLMGKYDAKLSFCQQSTDSRPNKFQAISGQTGVSYTCTASDVGAKIFCRATLGGVTTDSNDTERVISSSGSRMAVMEQTFVVTVEDISDTDQAYFIDGVQQPSIGITPDYEYHFDLSDPSNLGYTFRFWTDLAKTTEVDAEYFETEDDLGTLAGLFQGTRHQFVARSNALPGEEGAFVSIYVPSEAKEFIANLDTIYYEAAETTGHGGSITLLPGSAGTLNTVTITEAGTGYTDGAISLDQGDAEITITTDPSTGAILTAVVSDPGTGVYPYDKGAGHVVVGGNNDAVVTVETVYPYT